jgi:hypothetical protein
MNTLPVISGTARRSLHWICGLDDTWHIAQRIRMAIDQCCTRMPSVLDQARVRLG